MVLIIFLVIIGVLIMISIGGYNKLVAGRNTVANFYSQIDVQLKRRYDLIPNLVETAKGYLKHERETLEAVIAARNQAFGMAQAVAKDPTNAVNMQKLMNSEGGLASAMSRLMVVSENYPDLKGNTTMNGLMEELSSTENKISFARQAFNDSVMDYNTNRQIFPTVILANMFGFQAATHFEITNAVEKENVRVSF